MHSLGVHNDINVPCFGVGMMSKTRKLHKYKGRLFCLAQARARISGLSSKAIW